MTRVHIITEGEYDDFQIVSVHADYAAAEKLVEQNNDERRRGIGPPKLEQRVETWEVQ